MEEMEGVYWFGQGGKVVCMMCENEGVKIGLYRSGEMTGAVTSLAFRVSNACRHSVSNTNGVSAASRLLRGFAIFEKSFMNLL